MEKNPKQILLTGDDLPFSRSTAWRYRKSGQLDYYRIGNKIYYSPEHIQNFLNSCEIVSETQNLDGMENTNEQ
ncbi:MAG: helix-turn-helix domain-containing protein [Aridibacter sp.]